MKIKTSLKHRFNKNVLINNTWVKFNELGFAEIAEEKIRGIMNEDKSIEITGTQIITKEEVKEIKETKVIEVIEDDSMKSDLKQMSLKELKELCKTSNLKESEWSDLNKIKIIEYILSNLK